MFSKKLFISKEGFVSWLLFFFFFCKTSITHCLFLLKCAVQDNMEYYSVTNSQKSSGSKLGRVLAQVTSGNV